MCHLRSRPPLFCFQRDLQSLSAFVVLIFTLSLSFNSFCSSPLNTGCPMFSHQNKTKNKGWEKKTTLPPSSTIQLQALLSPVRLLPTLKQQSLRSPVRDIFVVKSTFQSSSDLLCRKHLTSLSFSSCYIPRLLVLFSHFWLCYPITHSTSIY